MNKHFIRPGFAAACGAVAMLIFMSLEARGAPLDVDHEARCYGAAVSAEKYEVAKVHRLAIRPYQDAQGQGIAYHTGYAIGFIDAGAALLEMPVPELANDWYKENCVVEDE